VRDASRISSALPNEAGHVTLLTKRQHRLAHEVARRILPGEFAELHRVRIRHQDGVLVVCENVRDIAGDEDGRVFGRAQIAVGQHSSSRIEPLRNEGREALGGQTRAAHDCIGIDPLDRAEASRLNVSRGARLALQAGPGHHQAQRSCDQSHADDASKPQ
jgi:hypothetical protein